MLCPSLRLPLTPRSRLLRLVSRRRHCLRTGATSRAHAMSLAVPWGREKTFRASRMTDTPPDRLSTDPDSPHYDAALLERGIGIRFAGQEKTNVEEYCVSEGWIRVAAGKALDRKGKPLTIKLKGPVEPYFKDSK